MIKDILVNGNGGWIGAVTRLGLPIVLSLLLTAFLVFKVDTALATVQTTTLENQEMIKSAQGSMRAYEEQTALNQRILRNIALQTCLNVAKTEVAQKSCLAAAEK